MPRKKPPFSDLPIKIPKPSKLERIKILGRQTLHKGTSVPGRTALYGATALATKDKHTAKEYLDEVGLLIGQMTTNEIVDKIGEYYKEYSKDPKGWELKKEVEKDFRQYARKYKLEQARKIAKKASKSIGKGIAKGVGSGLAISGIGYGASKLAEKVTGVGRTGFIDKPKGPPVTPKSPASVGDPEKVKAQVRAEEAATTAGHYANLRRRRRERRHAETISSGLP